MWASIHKVDKVRPQANGKAIVIVEDERNVATMSMVPSLSALIAVARVLNARRVLDLKYEGKGEIRYATTWPLPDFMMDAVTRAGASSTDREGNEIRIPASPASVSAIVDQAFAALAYHLRSSVGAADLPGALKVVEQRRSKAPITDRDANPKDYWTSVFELCALAGEISRMKGGRWIDTTDMPVPFAIKFPEGQLAMPAKLAMQIVEGTAEQSLATSDVEGPAGS
jgi:hypothetical protein